jgi:peptide/nickel transport system permease protein
MTIETPTPRIPDEHTSRADEVEEAVQVEESLEGRPFEVRSATHGFLDELLSDRTGLVGVAFLVLLVVVAVLAPVVAPYGATEGTLSTSNLAPVWDGGGWDHVLGTDPQGYDVLSRLIYGLRTTLLIGFAVVAIAGLFGVLVGLVAGYRGGRTDRWLMGWVDVQVAFPGLLLALIMIALIGGSVRSTVGWSTPA